MLGANSSPELSDVIVPLLVVADSVSADTATAVNQTAAPHDDEAVIIRTTTTERHIADQPVMIPDDLLIQSVSQQNDTVVQVATNDIQEPVSSYNTSVATVEATEAGYSEFSMSATMETEFLEINTTQEPSVEGENEDGSHATNTTGKLCLSLR